MNENRKGSLCYIGINTNLSEMNQNYPNTEKLIPARGYTLMLGH